MAFLFVFVGVSFMQPALAFPSLVPEVCQGAAPVGEGGCNLTAVEQTLANVAQIILGVTGSLTLLMFVIGGVMYMLSGGNSGKVEKANKIIKTTVLGLAIILLAGVAIKVLLKVLTGAA